MFMAEVLAAKVNEGVTKAGKRYHWCTIWIEGDDGSLLEVRSPHADFQKGMCVDIGVINNFGKPGLTVLGLHPVDPKY